jgi:hypothetical protein
MGNIEARMLSSRPTRRGVLSVDDRLVEAQARRLWAPSGMPLQMSGIAHTSRVDTVFKEYVDPFGLLGIATLHISFGWLGVRTKLG